MFPHQCGTFPHQCGMFPHHCRHVPSPVRHVPSPLQACSLTSAARSLTIAGMFPHHCRHVPSPVRHVPSPVRHVPSPVRHVPSPCAARLRQCGLFPAISPKIFNLLSNRPGWRVSRLWIAAEFLRKAALNRIIAAWHLHFSRFSLMIARSALRIARLSLAASRRNFNLLSTFFNLLFEKSAAVFAFGSPKPLKHLIWLSPALRAGRVPYWGCL
jgi:hypothetical protein